MRCSLTHGRHWCMLGAMKFPSVQLPELASAQSLGERAQDTAAIIGEARRGASPR